MGEAMDLSRPSELIYGRLLPIEEPHLIGRYNKALGAFGLPRTTLDKFEIDRSGFSPEVAAELGDPNYLDPNEVNRRFIILTPAQADALAGLGGPPLFFRAHALSLLRLFRSLLGRQRCQTCRRFDIFSQPSLV